MHGKPERIAVIGKWVPPVQMLTMLANHYESIFAIIVSAIIVNVFDSGSLCGHLQQLKITHFRILLRIAAVALAAAYFSRLSSLRH